MEALLRVKSGPPIGVGVGGSILGDDDVLKLDELDFRRSGLNIKTNPLIIIINRLSAMFFLINKAAKQY